MPTRQGPTFGKLHLLFPFVFSFPCRTGDSALVFFFFFVDWFSSPRAQQASQRGNDRTLK